MKNLFTTLFVVLFITNEIISQVVTGKLVDENGGELAGVRLQLYTSTNVYEDSSSSDGTFSFNIITGVEADNQLPTGYSVSDNFPNPFNPRTRINITLPNRENVKVEVFNLLGQSVADVIEETFESGTNNIDIELNGLSNGFYISRITIGDKYTIVKKLMLIYGSQHLITNGSTITSQLNKPNNNYLDTTLDSLVATSLIIGRKTFTSLSNFVSGTLDLGNLAIERYCSGTPTVLYEGKTYHTVQIGNQCWLKENLDVGTRIDGPQAQTDNGIIEKYCCDNDEANCAIYGGLYQWDELMQYVTTPGVKGICPTGWHLPTDEEWITLTASLGGASVAGGKMKSTGTFEAGTSLWHSPNTGATNESGFTALPGGGRNGNGLFSTLGWYGDWWSSTEDYSIIARDRYINYDYSILFWSSFQKSNGSSVRCVGD